jgi:hypothetical protein
MVVQLRPGALLDEPSFVSSEASEAAQRGGAV